MSAPVAHITLTNPPLNVIDLQMALELRQTLLEIESRPDISTVLFQGAAGNFSAGVDVKAHLPEHIHEMLTSFHAAIRAIVLSRKVTIAAVRGVCLGGGAELASVCDMVYTTRDANWGFPEIKLGCYPPVACTALAALVGQKRAAELILTGRTINGKEAADTGLATRAVPENNLDRTVEECVRQLLALSTVALAIAKKASYAWDSTHFDKGLACAEKVYFDVLMKTEDAHEGIRAFIEKRKPKWTGK